ncbi:MAG: hypothetical protein AB1421_10875 [Pseudomonadota bacterium]
MRLLYLILFPAVLATGCAHPPEHTPPIGRLNLNAPLTIPAGAASVRIQYGRTTAFNAVQEHDPFCVFEIDAVADSPRILPPAGFDVLTLERSVSTFAGLPIMPYHTRRVVFGPDDLPTHIYFKTRFMLASDARNAQAATPERALGLTCMSNQHMPGIAIMRHLSLADIRGALGDLFTLELHVPR